MSSFWHNIARLAPLNPPNRRRGTLWRVFLAGVVFAGGGALAWSVVGAKTLSDFSGPQHDYNNLLVDGFRQGHLWMDVEPPEALKRLENPWDPANRVGLETLHDVSFYRGHYYLYFGVVPATTLFLPFRLLTGHPLPESVGYLVFALGAYLLGAWLWLRLLADNFPGASKLTEIAGILGIGLAGGQWVLARRVSIWEPSIIAGHFFLLATLVACYRAFSSRSPLWWLTLAGTMLALAVGCRPTLGVAGLGMFWVVYVVGNRMAADSARSPASGWVRASVAGAVPLLVCLLPLLAYNYARFGNPLEFGLHYQLTTAYEKEAVHFRAAFLPYNFRLYFTSWPQWGRYFPFVHPIAGSQNAEGYYGYENVYGAFTFCPLIWACLFLPVLALGAPRLIREFVPLVAVTFATTCLTLLFFNTATARYVVDFLPWLLWLALLGWALAEASLVSASARFCARCFVGSALVVSLLAAFFLNCDLHDILRSTDPITFNRLSRIFDVPAALWERGRPAESGPVAMTVRFTAHPAAAVEPLVVTGAEYQKDYFYVSFESATSARVGYARTSRPPIESEPFSFVPGQAYRFRFEGGSLYPPAGFPDFADWEPSERAAVKEWARVSLDGRMILEAHADGNEASPGTVQIGADPEGVYGKRFSGTIDSVERLGRKRMITEMSWPGQPVISFTVPQAPWVAALPLLEIGEPGSAVTLGLRYADATHYVLTYEEWGSGHWTSAPIPLGPDRHETLRIQAGPLLGLSPDSAVWILSHTVTVWRGDEVVLSHYSPLVSLPVPKVAFLSNRVGSSILEDRFTGRLNELHTIPLAPAWRNVPCGSIELVLRSHGLGTEPLVSTGVGGAGDLLSIAWLGGGKACVVYDHWGLAFTRSEPFAWSEEGYHRVRIRLPALEGPAGKPLKSPDSGLAEVTVDGRSVWTASVPFYRAEPASVSVGTNTIKSSSAASILTAAAIGIRQE